MPVVTTGAISVAELCFSYGDRVIFDGLSARFEPGTMTGLVGPSGSGKSTLLSLLMGQLSPGSGRIDRPESVLRGGELDPGRFAWVMQTANVFVRRTAAENVSLPVRLRGLPERIAQGRARDALASVGLGDRLDTRCGLLSGGERQRVAVARALATRAPVLIADEPTVSLDHANRDLLVAAIRRAAEHGAVVIVATHDPEVYGACDALVTL